MIFRGKKSKRKFVRGRNPFKNKVSVQMYTPKFFEVNASAYSKI